MCDYICVDVAALRKWKFMVHLSHAFPFPKPSPTGAPSPHFPTPPPHILTPSALTHTPSPGQDLVAIEKDNDVRCPASSGTFPLNQFLKKNVSLHMGQHALSIVIAAYLPSVLVCRFNIIGVLPTVSELLLTRLLCPLVHFLLRAAVQGPLTNGTLTHRPVA